MLSDQRTSVAGRVFRVLCGVLLVATCLRVWLGPVTALPQARAQIPDAGLQRRELFKEMQKTNVLLSQILKTMQTQTFKVQMPGADNKQGLPARPVRPGTE